MKKETTSVHYINYLHLDKVLDAQHPISCEGEGEAAHEEMLFIIIHQTYELWFKQILHELNSAMVLFKADKIDESSVGVIVSRMERVMTILDVLVKQLDILETMTSLDFLDFRHHLSPASGFQSHQFRKFEVLLGLKIKKRHHFDGRPYHEQFKGSEKQEILDLEKSDSFFSLIEKWLERIPFLKMEGFNFTQKYEAAVNKMLAKEIATIKAADLTDSDREIRLRMIDENRKYYKRVLSEDMHKQAIKEGDVSLSYKATMSALLINLYRDDPILHLPYKFLRTVVEVDHKVATWRFRHVQMVEKMLGMKIGTGGSSGQGYLSETVHKHRIFRDLANISTLMISRPYIPVLPQKIKEQLGFNYKK